MISAEGQALGHSYTMSHFGGSCLCRACDPPTDFCDFEELEDDPTAPACVDCGQEITHPSLIRLGSTSCLDCPPTAPYPMRFTHP